MDKVAVKTKEEAIEWIHNLKTLGIKPGLIRMEWLLERLGHPERSLKFVHIAGTNGKGSTASFLTQVLRKSGYKVGTFTSPYLIDFTNRIQVNGEDISGEHLVELTNKIIPLCNELGQSEWGKPTEFEVITTIAILYYAKIAYPDIVVWETGLGGRLDSTNVVMPLVSVITNIGYDHMDLLGYDIKDIAKEKAGIIKPGVPVVSSVEDEEALSVIKDTAKAKKSSIYQINEQFFVKAHNMNKNGSTIEFAGPYLTMPDVVIKMVGPHQVKNAATALMTLELLRQFYAFYIDEDAVYSGMRSTFWPGRFELLSENPTLVIDGAHNAEGAMSLKQSISLYEYDKLILVTGILADKAVKNFFKEIVPIADELIITEPDNPRAAKSSEISDIIQSIDKSKKVTIINDWSIAVEEAINRANPNDLVIFTGSLYLISDIRRYILNNLKESIKL